MTLFQERPFLPMLAKNGEPFDSDKHFFEVKWDGLRALLFLANGKIELQNRNLRDATTSYPEVQSVAKKIRARKAIIDGEIVVLNGKGVPDFGRLQTRFGHNDPKRVDIVRRSNPATYVAFDLLHIDGQDIIRNPLEDRKSKLKRVLVESPHLLYGDHAEKKGRIFNTEALKLGFEGIIAKEKNSQYLTGVRSSSWIKIKGTKTLDAIVVGYSGGEGARSSSFGSLIMAMYDADGTLVHVGNVGGGFDNKTLVELKPKLDRLATRTPQLNGPIEAPPPITWVKPRMVCEVLYSNITTDKKLRFPRFSRIRLDKNPEECQLDEDILSR